VGDSDALRVGQWLLALGFPFGLQATVTAGIVSALGRHPGILRTRYGDQAALEHFIQTDAAINPGNSGGPVINLAGEVVGLSSAIFSPTGYYAGYGFAVPIRIAQRVASDLLTSGEVRRPDLGATLEDVLPADAEVYHLPAVAGAEIVGLDPGGAAARAGARLGDVIVAVGSDRVGSAGDTRDRVARHTPDDRLSLRIIRYGKPGRLSVRLGRLRVEVPPTPGQVHPGHLVAGFRVADDQGLVRVVDVFRYGPAARAGLRPGQVITAAFQRPVRSLAELRATLDLHPPPAAVSLHVTDPVLGPRILNFRPGISHQPG
jgi:S1-C subfamily serine protease